MSMMYDSRIPQSAIPVARETLALSDAARGLQGMTAPNTGMTTQETGPYAMPGMVTAGAMQEQLTLAGQQISQDMQTAGPQAIAGARGAMIAAESEANNAQAQAQQMLFNRTANIIDSTTGGGALMQFNALMQSPEGEKVRSNLMTQEAMRDNKAPELGAEAAQSMQYRMM